MKQSSLRRGASNVCHSIIGDSSKKNKQDTLLYLSAIVAWLLVLGHKEVEAGTVAVRRHGEGDLGPMGVAEFGARVQLEIEREQGRAA